VIACWEIGESDDRSIKALETMYKNMLCKDTLRPNDPRLHCVSLPIRHDLSARQRIALARYATRHAKDYNDIRYFYSAMCAWVDVMQEVGLKWTILTTVRR
jgi:hypothetical protein